MDGKKEYSIVINGIKESVDAVESLNKQLYTLEKRIDAVSKKNVNVSNSSSSSGGGSKNDDLAAEEKLQRQIINQEDKIIGARKDEYQILLQQKAEFKEINELQKANVANARLQDDAYANTMQGMKQQLADIKAVMQTTDVDSDKFRQLGEQANALNEKLKQIEQSYGQYGRNVGNYANSIADGLSKVVVKVGDVDRTFKSARDASRTLNNELKSLSINGKRGTKEWKELNSAIIKMNASINGSSLALQRMITMLQGFSAAAQVGKGITSLFGFDNQEITQSIQKLVALQSVLSGLQTIQKQLAANKGLGLIFNGAFGKIDQYNFALKRMIVSLSGTGTAARVAAAGVNFLSGALKGLMSLGVIALITAAISAISKIGTKIKEWAKGNADLVSSEKLLERQLEQTNKELERKLELNNKLYGSGQITQDEKKIEDEKAYADAIGKANDALQKQLELASKRGSNKSFANAALGNQSWFGDKGVTTFGGFDKALSSMDELVKRYELLTKAVEKNKGVTENANSEWGRVSLSASDARDELNHLEQLVAGDMVNSFRKFNLATEDGRKQFINFVQNIQQNGNELQKSVLFRMGDILNQKQPELANALNGYLDIVGQFVTNFNGETEKLNIMNEVNNAIRSADPTIALKEQNEKWKKYLEENKDTLMIGEVAQIQRAMDANDKKIREYGQKKVNSIKTAAKKEQNAVEDTQDRINELRIKLMNEGLQKELRQLDEENRQTINKIKQNSKNVQVELALQEKLYLKQRQELISEAVDEHNRTMAELDIKEYENRIDDLTNQIENLRTKGYPKIRTPFTKEELTNELNRLGTTIERLKDANKVVNDVLTDDDVAELTKKYEDEIKLTGDFLKDEKAIYLKYGAQLSDIVTEFDDDTWGVNNLQDSLNTRLKALDEYDKSYREEIKKLTKQRKADRKELLDAERENELTSLSGEYKTYIEQYLKFNISPQSSELDKDGMQDMLNKITEYQNKAAEIRYRYKNKEIEQERALSQEISQITEERYGMLLTSLSEFLSKANDLEQKQPVLGKTGFINIKKTKANLQEAEDTIINELLRISRARTKLEEDYEDGLITPEAMNAINMQLNDLENSMSKTLEGIGKKTKETLPEFLRQLEQAFQLIGQNAQQMITAFGDLYDFNIEKQQEALEKQNKLLEEQLSKQKDIVDKYSGEIEDIENELAESRGDRRAHLIDQLNAEMEARREAAAEQKRLEQEQKELERQQEELDKKKARAQWKRDLAQILISGAMAAANGYATKPFLPTGLLMGALATTLTAAQYAIAKKQKPYAKGGELDGGVIKGKRHYAGGVSVLGGRASVEGGEFITNRVTTAKNADLLGYINTKKHKIDLSELIDFYQKPIKANGRNRRVFADGGQLPTIPDIDLSSSMANLAVIRDDRPITVSVVDINNKQDDVRRVKVLAGINK